MNRNIACKRSFCITGGALREHAWQRPVRRSPIHHVATPADTAATSCSATPRSNVIPRVSAAAHTALTRAWIIGLSRALITEQAIFFKLIQCRLHNTAGESAALFTCGSISRRLWLRRASKSSALRRGFLRPFSCVRRTCLNRLLGRQASALASAGSVALGWQLRAVNLSGNGLFQSSSAIGLVPLPLLRRR